MKFIVKTNIDHNGTRYKPGQEIELTPAEAAEMPWAVQAPTLAAPKTSKEEGRQ